MHFIYGHSLIVISAQDKLSSVMPMESVNMCKKERRGKTSDKGPEHCPKLSQETMPSQISARSRDHEIRRKEPLYCEQEGRQKGTSEKAQLTEKKKVNSAGT